MNKLNKVALVTVFSMLACVAFAADSMTEPEALKALFPDATFKSEVKTLTDAQVKDIGEKSGLEVDVASEKTQNVNIAYVNNKVVGYVIEETTKGKWGNIVFMTAINPNGSVKEVVVLASNEKKGKPVTQPHFLNQFVGKTLADKLEVKKDIQGISGATISSRAMTKGVKKVLNVFAALNLKN